MFYKARFNKQLDRFGVIDRHDPEMRIFLGQRMGVAEASGAPPFLAAALASLGFLHEVKTNFPDKEMFVAQGLERIRIICDSEEPGLFAAIMARLAEAQEAVA